MEDQTHYTTPLAKWARILEIFVPGYMFGKSWGISDEKTVDLFRAMFPPFLIDGAELLKKMIHTDNVYLQRLISTSAGAVVGFLVIAAVALIIHFVLRDRKYIDTLRFTAICMIPIAVLNGTLSHVVKTLVENLTTQAPETLKDSVVRGPWNFLMLNFAFFMTALWMMGRRTGVKRSRRWGILAVGAGFMVLFVALGLMIFPAEWNALLPRLQQSLSH